MKNIFLLLFLLLGFQSFAQNAIVYYNGKTGTYPARPATSQKVRYIGQVSPAEIGANGFRLGYDIWTIDAVKPTVTIDINAGNIATLQTLINNSSNAVTTRFFFRASVPTTYRDISLNCSAKEGIQFVGETDAQGRNLVTFNGSTLLTSWTLDAGKYRHSVTGLTTFTDPLDSVFCETGFRCHIEQLVYRNHKPLIPVSSVALVNDSTKFFFDSSLGRVWISTNPSGATLEYAQYKSAIHCGVTAANYPNATSNVVVKNLNFEKYTGNTTVGVVGGRGYIYTTGFAYPSGTAVFGWLVMNCNFNLNRGTSIFLHSRGTAIGNNITDTGITSVTSTYPATRSGYNPTSYTNILNNVITADGWAGVSSGYHNGLKVVSQRKVKIKGNIVKYSGLGFWNRPCKTYSIWYDYNDDGICENNYIYNSYGAPLHIEASNNTLVQGNIVYDNVLAQITPAPHAAGIYIVTGNNNIIRNNRFEFRKILAPTNYDVKLFFLRKSTATYGGSLFTGQSFTCSNNQIINNIFILNNTSGFNSMEFQSADTAVSPVYSWVYNNGNIFRNNTLTIKGLATQNFIITGAGTVNLSTWESYSTNFQSNTITGN
jgi:hypothetical protein